MKTSDAPMGNMSTEGNGDSNPPRILLIGNQVPVQPRGGAGLRLAQLLYALGEVAEVRFWGVGEQGDLHSELPENVRVHGFRSWKPLSAPNKLGAALRFGLFNPLHDPYASYLHRSAWSRDLKRTLAKFRPNLVVFSEPWLARYLPIVRKAGVPIIHDMHNYEARLRAEAIRSRRGLPRLVERWRAGRIVQYERRLIEASIAVWACGAMDQAAIQEDFPDVVAHNVPNSIHVDGFHGLSRAALPSKRSIGYVSTFNYAPNVRAAERIVHEILPRLRQTDPDAEAWLVGKHPPKWLQEMDGQDGVHVTGPVDDLQEFIAKIRTMVVPLETGGGTRLKVLEAFAAGRPVVSTRKGAEGIAATQGVHILFAEADEEIATAVQRLWKEAELEQSLRANALQLARSEYSWEDTTRRVKDSLQKLGFSDF